MLEIKKDFILCLALIIEVFVFQPECLSAFENQISPKWCSEAANPKIPFTKKIFKETYRRKRNQENSETNYMIEIAF